MNWSFYHYKMFFLPLLTFLFLKSILSDIITATPALLWLLFAWSTFMAFFFYLHLKTSLDLEGERGRETGNIDVRKKHWFIASCTHLDGGPNLWPTCVPWPRTECELSVGRLSNQLSYTGQDCLLPSFYFQPTCIFTSKFYLLYKAYTWVLNIFIQYDNLSPSDCLID